LSKAVTRRFEFTLFYTTNGKIILKRMLKKWGGGKKWIRHAQDRGRWRDL
jgi:hypothetical protein